MDESLDFLLEATDYLEQYIPINDVDVILEATPFAKAANKNNRAAGSGALASIKKAINALITIIRKAIAAVTNFIQEAFMSKEDRTKFAYFKKLAANDKQFANRPIRVSDYRAYEKLYDGHLNELDRLYKRGATVEELNQVTYRLNKALNTLRTKAGAAGSAAVVAIGMKAAVDLADRNVIAAKALNKQLNDEQSALSKMLGLVSDERAAKFKGDVANYSRNGFFHRMKVRILQRKQNDLVACGKQIKKSIFDFTEKDKDGKVKVTGKSLARGAAKHTDVVGAAVDAVAGRHISSQDVGRAALKAVDTVGQAESHAKAAKRIFGNG